MKFDLFKLFIFYRHCFKIDQVNTSQLCVYLCVSTQEFISGYRICFFLFCDSNNLLVCIKVYSLLIDLPVLTKCLLLGADSSHPIHATKNNAIINKGAHQHSQHSDRGASGTV